MVDVLSFPRLPLNIQDVGWAIKLYFGPFREVIQVISLNFLVKSLVCHSEMPFRNRLNFFRNFHSLL
jgi:hypothetical protein